MHYVPIDLLHFCNILQEKKMKYSFGTYKCYLIKINLNLQKKKNWNFYLVPFTEFYLNTFPFVFKMISIVFVNIKLLMQKYLQIEGILHFNSNML